MAGVAGDGPDLARELEDVREQQRAISGVLRAVARSAGLQPVLEEVAEACRRLCEADHGALWLLQDGLLHVGAHRGEPEGAQYDLEHPHPVDRTTAAGRAAIERKPIQIPDVLADPEYTYPGPRFFRTMLGVPIMVEDDLIGVVVLVRREPKPFTDDHIALVQTFADQAAIALTNARLLDAFERQRTELSRFVSPQVADLISSEDGQRLLAGHRAYISSLFCDLRGFTAFAETAAPEELFDVLREYHAVLGELIPAYQGTLEHFAGDGVMVFFNDPLPVDEHELQAIRLALAAQTRFAELATRLAQARNRPGARNRDRGRLRDPGAHRLRGPIRLRRSRAGDERRFPTQHACFPRPDAHRAARLRGDGGGGRDDACRQPRPERVRTPGGRLRGAAGALAVQRRHPRHPNRMTASPPPPEHPPGADLQPRPRPTARPCSSLSAPDLSGASSRRVGLLPTS
jgi:GAF domain-containing protein